MKNRTRKIINCLEKLIKPLFIVYVCVLIFVVILKFPTWLAWDVFQKRIHGNTVTRLEPQLIPFKTITLYWNSMQTLTDWFGKNLICNIIIFIPYGFLIPFLMKESKGIFLKTVISGIIVITFIEIFQYVSALGHCDVDDLIMNTLSILIGYGFYLLTKMFLRKIQEK